MSHMLYFNHGACRIYPTILYEFEAWLNFISFNMPQFGLM